MKSSMLSLILILLFSGSIGHSQTPPAPPLNPQPVHQDSPVPAPTPALSISGPTSFPEGTLAQYSIAGVANTAFQVFPIGSGSSYLTNDGIFIFTAPAGTYNIFAATTNSANKIVFLAVVITVTPSSNSNIPMAMAIFDSTQLTSLPSGQVAIYTSQTVGSSLGSKNVTYLKNDSTDWIMSTSGSSPIMSTKWGQAANSVGLPALVFINSGNITPFPLPADEASLITAVSSLLKKNRGQ